MNENPNGNPIPEEPNPNGQTAVPPQAPAEPTEPPVAPQPDPATQYAPPAQAAPNPYTAPVTVLQRNTADHGMAVASLVLGIVGLVTCCCYGVMAIVLGAIGLILGIISRKHGNNEGVSLAGIILSSISLALGIFFFIYIVLVMIGAMSSGLYEEFYEEFMNEYYQQGGNFSDGYLRAFLSQF